MGGDHDQRGHTGPEQRPPTASPDRERPTKDGEGRCRAKAKDFAGFDGVQFCFQPRTASQNLASERLRMEPTSTGGRRGPLEVLHRIRDVDVSAFPTRLFERFVQNGAGRSDKGTTSVVFLVSGLLPDHHDVGIAPPFAEHRLRGCEIKRAALAMAGRCGQHCEVA